MKIKRILSTVLIVIFAISQNSYCIAEEKSEHDFAALEHEVNKNSESLHNVIRGRIQHDEGILDRKNFTGEIESVKEGSKLKMTVTSVISSGLNREGDQFFAEITNDFSTKSGIVIPTGTIAHGTVSQLENSKRLGRDGYIDVNFDYLIMPDGRKVEIEANMTTKRHPVSSTAKVVLEDTAYTVTGGVVGGFMALKFLGLGTAVATKGWSVAGGAGIGAIVGLTTSLFRKGSEVLIIPGDEINVRIVENIDLPVITEESLRDKELHYEGLDVKITQYAIEKDPFGELNTITITLDIKNKTQKAFSSFDIALVNEYKRVYYPSPFGNTELWFKNINPNSKTIGKLSFSVDNPKKKHWLVFYDNRSREPLAKFSLRNAERSLRKVNN